MFCEAKFLGMPLENCPHWGALVCSLQGTGLAEPSIKNLSGKELIISLTQFLTQDHSRNSVGPKRIQVHRERLSISSPKHPVFSNTKTIVLFLIKTSKTRFTRHCTHLDCINFKAIEKLFAFKCNSDY